MNFWQHQDVDTQSKEKTPSSISACVQVRRAKIPKESYNKKPGSSPGRTVQVADLKLIMLFVVIISLFISLFDKMCNNQMLIESLVFMYTQSKYLY